MPSWEYLADGLEGVPYCAKNMNAYSTWRATLLKLEYELLTYCKANAIVLQPESITSEMLEWMVHVKEWFLAGAESEQQSAESEQPLEQALAADPTPADLESAAEGKKQMQVVSSSSSSSCSSSSSS